MDEIRSNFGKKERSTSSHVETVEQDCEPITIGCLTLVINRGRTNLDMFVD